MMNRRTFLQRSGLIAMGGLILASSPTLAGVAINANELKFDADLYQLFKNPTVPYRPFARWWWNGNKVTASELVRELRLLKAAGIGGVEIYPVGLPTGADDVGIPTLRWLSNEWIQMLNVAFDEADRLEMTCDLMVGTGWPYAGDFVAREDRAQVVLIHAEKMSGPDLFEISRYALLKAVDPEVTVPVATRTFEILSLTMAPDPLNSLDQVVDLGAQRNDEIIRIEVPQGEYYLYALVKCHDFAGAINGAPGGDGPFIDHFKEGVVRRYLDHFAQTIQDRLGPLSARIRSFLHDSMELEGANWTDNMAELFKARFNYDLMPYLPYLMWKVHRLGEVHVFEYGSKHAPEFAETLGRVRYDFDLLKAELLDKNYTQVYLQWCREMGVQSKGQAYGRGFFSLESSLGYDIPEGESWTTNYLQHLLGEEMPNDDYRRGRGYVMINKYVSSAAHLTGKRVVSAEEMTNTYRVFNETFELLKLGSDQAIISGITQSIYHGFNYSPPEAPFPGWIQYGSYYNDQHNWWPYFHHFNRYKARLATVLQNADMYTDIALLTCIPDTWTKFGVQTDPFPGPMSRMYTSLVWEAIHKTGGGCDYTSETVLQQSTVDGGALRYGPKAYKHLFLVGIEGIEVETLQTIYDFVRSGGHVFCIENYPFKSLGLHHSKQRDAEVVSWVEKLKAHPDRFILLDKPAEDDFFNWYPEVQQRYKLPQYMQIETPNLYLMQNRYRTDSGAEVIFLAYAHRHEPHTTRLSFSNELLKGRNAWVWDPLTGEKYRLGLDKKGGISVTFGPTDSLMLIFDKINNKKAPLWQPLPARGSDTRTLSGWDVELHHRYEGWSRTTRMEQPIDLKGTEWESFSGTVLYKTMVEVNDSEGLVLNLGEVQGISELKVNGQNVGVQWSGYHLYDLGPWLQSGSNQIEIAVITTMGNYMKTLIDNPIAMKWVSRPGRPQAIQSMGILGPVTLYKK